ncbi:hypothetical protein ACO0QE_002385 [Hanseniaspora vineae]
MNNPQPPANDDMTVDSSNHEHDHNTDLEQKNNANPITQPTQPTQQATQATQKNGVEKFTQDKLDDNIVCRIICTSGAVPIRDLRADFDQVYREPSSVKHKWSFGRNPHAVDFHLGDIARLSNVHFYIWLGEDGNLMIRDNSTNGTWCNGSKLERGQNYMLSQGDEITVGFYVPKDVLSFIVFVNESYKKKLQLYEINERERQRDVEIENKKRKYVEMDEGDRGDRRVALPYGSKSADEHGSSVHLHLSHKPDTRLTGIHKDFSVQDEVVGQGAFATVKKAIERSTGRTFAVKIINKRKLIGTKLDGVQRELEVLKILKHPRIVMLKAYYECPDNYYLVMEYVPGGDLMDFVAANGAIDEFAAREVSRQILQAIEYMHKMKISHRDLKPDNILIEQDDPVLVKVTDFGLAKAQNNGTIMKTFCGTLAYIAPEVVMEQEYVTPPRGGGNNNNNNNNNNNDDDEANNNMRKRLKRINNEYSPLVDMWSMGCLVYVLLTGHLPFSGGTQHDLFKQIKNGAYHAIPLRDNRVSPQGISFIEALLQVDPLKRLNATEALQHEWIRGTNVEGEEYVSSVPLSQNLRGDSKKTNHTTVSNGPNNQEHEDDALVELNKKFKIPNIPVQRFTQPPPPPKTELKSPFELKLKKEADMNESFIGITTDTRFFKKEERNGIFITLHANFDDLEKFNAPEAINIFQGQTRGFFVGRDSICDFAFPNVSVLSKIHFMIIKRRHVVANSSIYESAAAALDDVWLYAFGTNAMYVNGHKLAKGYKCKIYNEDTIKFVWDKKNNMTIEYSLRILDGTGLYLGGSRPFEPEHSTSICCPSEILKQDRYQGEFYYYALENRPIYKQNSKEIEIPEAYMKTRKRKTDKKPVKKTSVRKENE